jgi:hypothetical protein
MSRPAPGDPRKPEGVRTGQVGVADRIGSTVLAGGVPVEPAGVWLRRLGVVPRSVRMSILTNTGRYK